MLNKICWEYFMQQFINVSWITIVSGSSENIWYALATFELKINAM